MKKSGKILYSVCFCDCLRGKQDVIKQEKKLCCAELWICFLCDWLWLTRYILIMSAKTKPFVSNFLWQYMLSTRNIFGLHPITHLYRSCHGVEFCLGDQRHFIICWCGVQLERHVTQTIWCSWDQKAPFLFLSPSISLEKKYLLSNKFSKLW